MHPSEGRTNTSFSALNLIEFKSFRALGIALSQCVLDVMASSGQPNLKLRNHRNDCHLFIAAVNSSSSFLVKISGEQVSCI